MARDVEGVRGLTPAARETSSCPTAVVNSNSRLLAAALLRKHRGGQAVFMSEGRTHTNDAHIMRTRRCGRAVGSACE